MGKILGTVLCLSLISTHSFASDDNKSVEFVNSIVGLYQRAGSIGGIDLFGISIQNHRFHISHLPEDSNMASGKSYDVLGNQGKGTTEKVFGYFNMFGPVVITRKYTVVGQKMTLTETAESIFRKKVETITINLLGRQLEYSFNKEFYHRSVLGSWLLDKTSFDGKVNSLRDISPVYYKFSDTENAYEELVDISEQRERTYVTRGDFSKGTRRRVRTNSDTVKGVSLTLLPVRTRCTNSLN